MGDIAVRLIELEPRWLLDGERRVGVAFKCPNPERRKWWLTCFAEPTPHDRQSDAVDRAVGDTDMWVPCNEAVGWNFKDGIERASFETLSITPSLNAGDMVWHGFVTNGECVG